jgi:hypothetical protein
MRIVGDLDLLVREAQVDGAVAALEKAGFGVGTARESFEADPHHLPLRVHAESRVGVELHTRPAPRSLDALLDVAQYFRDARPRQWRGYQVLVWTSGLVTASPRADRRRPLLAGIPRLRQLLDLGPASRAPWRDDTPGRKNGSGTPDTAGARHTVAGGVPLEGGGWRGVRRRPHVAQVGHR